MDRPSDFWRNLIRELMAEHAMSFRELGRLTRIGRKTISHFLSGRTVMKMDRLETILAVFGYELDAIPRKEAT